MADITFRLSVGSEQEPDVAASYLEDIILDAELAMPRHTKTWVDENTVVIGPSSKGYPEDLFKIFDGMQWAARVACLDTFYCVILDELHSGEVRLNHRTRAEIQRQHL